MRVRWGMGKRPDGGEYCTLVGPFEQAYVGRGLDCQDKHHVATAPFL